MASQLENNTIELQSILAKLTSGGSSEITETIEYSGNLEYFDYNTWYYNKYGTDPDTFAQAVILPSQHTPTEIISWSDNSGDSNYLYDVVIADGKMLLLYSDIYYDNSLTVTYKYAPSGPAKITKGSFSPSSITINKISHGLDKQPDFLVVFREYAYADSTVNSRRTDKLIIMRKNDGTYSGRWSSVNSKLATTTYDDNGGSCSLYVYNMDNPPSSLTNSSTAVFLNSTHFGFLGYVESSPSASTASQQCGTVLTGQKYYWIAGTY